MNNTSASRFLDVVIGAGLAGLVVLNAVWVWPIATFRLF